MFKKKGFRNMLSVDNKVYFNIAENPQATVKHLNIRIIISSNNIQSLQKQRFVYII